MHEPVDQLIEEHRNILRGVKILEQTSKFEELPKVEIGWLIDFFRGYADVGHHAKEEAVLFRYLTDKNPELKNENSPLSILEEQHVQGRALVGRIGKMDSSYEFVSLDYADLLRRHIDMEDTLFPVLVEDNFDDLTKNKVLREFIEADAKQDLNGLLKLLDRIEINLL